MKEMPLQTPETLRQLDNKFWLAIRKLANVRTSYFRKGHTEKVKPQEELLNLFSYLNGLMKQMTVKIANHSRTVAIAIANDAISNPKKRKEDMSNLLRLSQIFRDLQVDAGNEKRMSEGIGNLASGTRGQINPVITNVRNQIAQIEQREQQLKKQRQLAGKK